MINEVNSASASTSPTRSSTANNIDNPQHIDRRLAGTPRGGGSHPRARRHMIPARRAHPDAPVRWNQMVGIGRRRGGARGGGDTVSVARPTSAKPARPRCDHGARSAPEEGMVAGGAGRPRGRPRAPVPLLVPQHGSMYCQSKCWKPYRRGCAAAPPHHPRDAHRATRSSSGGCSPARAWAVSDGPPPPAAAAADLYC